MSTSARDRLAAWLVTGPLARIAGFFAELAVALWHVVTRTPQGED